MQHFEARHFAEIPEMLMKAPVARRTQKMVYLLAVAAAAVAVADVAVAAVAAKD